MDRLLRIVLPLWIASSTVAACTAGSDDPGGDTPLSPDASANGTGHSAVEGGISTHGGDASNGDGGATGDGAGASSGSSEGGSGDGSSLDATGHPTGDALVVDVVATPDVAIVPDAATAAACGVCDDDYQCNARFGHWSSVNGECVEDAVKTTLRCNGTFGAPGSQNAGHWHATSDGFELDWESDLGGHVTTCTRIP